MDDRTESIGSSFPAPNIGRCIYGFVLFLVSIVSLVIYYLWAFIPRYLIEMTGITYFPSKYWAISIPIFFLMFILLFGFVLYPAINLFLTPSLTNVSTIYDRYYCKADLKSFNNNGDWNQGIPHIKDLPLDFVCQKLYLKKNF
ncbi:phosphatidylinositol glycan anchor biosynthesis class P [Dermatophagoides pteronyssinus]|uniref:Phosphatidylinositol N-acetylglucosaminyltransferase subunit P n=1 Tax=Dermatophagoides pteronyssinus TaxID=6956 RepID=A0A6P6XVM3_DERPT|nr:phosphatidylinositol N-acetylglucosaminyltransferase subunit P-like [Dermatophagoides pteronyssinus]